MKETKEEILEKVSKIIATKLGIEREEVKPESFIINLGADSLETVDISNEVEKEFGINFDDKEVGDLKSINDIILLVLEKTE